MPGKDFAVIGLGRFGSSICRTLRELGHDVLGIDESLARVQEMRAYVTDAVQVDATDPEVLRGIGITEYNAVVVAIGADLESSILVTVVLKELGVRRVVYVACDPGSLARDAAGLVEAGYKPLALQVVDMFPQTHHVESVMSFELPA